MGDGLFAQKVGDVLGADDFFALEPLGKGVTHGLLPVEIKQSVKCVDSSYHVRGRR